MNMTSVYAPIFKSTPQEDGSLLVYGKATDSSLDLDSQVCDSEWLKEAVPRWFSVGNIRESHAHDRAVGKATELEAKDDGGHYVKAKILDPLAKAKVEAGILSGFSIGIKNPRVVKDASAPGGRIIGGRIVELSLVDFPANEGCRLDLVKAVKPGVVASPTDFDADRMLIKVEELHEEVPSAGDLAERLSKAASSISSAQDLAARLGKAADTATSDEDSPEPAVDPVEVVSVGDVKKEVDALETELVSPSVTIGTGSKYAGDEPQQTKTIEVTVQGPSETRDAITKALIDELRVRSAEEVRRHSNKGAMPPIEEGGKPRYPINSVADLKNAIQAFGRAKDSDKAKVKAHIKAEAKRLGESALIPDNWKALLVKDAAALNAMDDSDGWRHDPTQLRTVLSGLADCMKAELDELVAGDNELWDLTQLLSSISGFCSWWSSEAAGGETESPYTEGGSVTELAATPDATKAAEPVESTTEAPVVEKTIEADKADDAPKTAEPSSEDLAELVKSAVAEATKGLTTAAEEREAALATELNKVKADLAKVLALPEPGGPVITRTAAQAAVARESDAMELHAAVNELLNKAEKATDPTLRRGYKERAEALKLKIA
jgi:phage head maturation protease